MLRPNSTQTEVNRSVSSDLIEVGSGPTFLSVVEDNLMKLSLWLKTGKFSTYLAQHALLFHPDVLAPFSLLNTKL